MNSDDYEYLITEIIKSKDFAPTCAPHIESNQERSFRRFVNIARTEAKERIDTID